MRCRQIRIYDFTKRELEVFLQRANFTADEETLFLLRSKDCTLEQAAEEMNVNDGGVADVTYDKVILPSLEQMYIVPQISGEGEAHQYYKELNGTDTPYKQYGTFPELVTYAIENHSSAQNVRLRSAYRSSAYTTWNVTASGYVGGNYASNAFRFSPLVFIGASPISAPTDAELGV